MQYHTNDQERVDQLCATVYGQQAGIVELIFERNPHLAQYDSYLPAGVVIDLPPLSILSRLNSTPARKTIQLWD